MSGIYGTQPSGGTGWAGSELPPGTPSYVPGQSGSGEIGFNPTAPFNPLGGYKTGANPYGTTGSGLAQPGAVGYGAGWDNSQQAPGVNAANTTANFDANGNMIPQYGGGVGTAEAVANQYGERALQSMSQAAPTVDQTNVNADRAGSYDALGQLGQTARGQGAAINGLAHQVSEGTKAAQAAQMAGAASARGGGPGVASAHQTAQMQNARLAGQGAQTFQAQKAQMMANAQNQYAQAAQGLQGSETGLAMGQAGLAQNQGQLNQQGALGYAGLANQTLIAQGNADASTFAANMGQAAQQSGYNAQLGNSLIGAGSGLAAGSMGYLSQQGGG